MDRIAFAQDWATLPWRWRHFDPSKRLKLFTQLQSNRGFQPSSVPL